MTQELSNPEQEIYQRYKADAREGIGDITPRDINDTLKEAIHEAWEKSRNEKFKEATTGMVEQLNKEYADKIKTETACQIFEELDDFEISAKLFGITTLDKKELKGHARVSSPQAQARGGRMICQNCGHRKTLHEQKRGCAVMVNIITRLNDNSFTIGHRHCNCKKFKLGKKPRNPMPNMEELRGKGISNKWGSGRRTASQLLKKGKGD